jgi:hypothetical protein
VKQKSSLLAIILVLIIIFSCKEDNPVIPPEPPDAVLKDTLTLSIMDVTHRSISVKVKTTNNGTGKQIQLFRKAETEPAFLPVTIYSATVLDTTIIDYNNSDGLLLDTEYSYYSVRLDSLGMPEDSSNIVSGRTLAATSHDFTAQIFTFGDFSSSVLNDVAIIDENNIWAVGEIYLNDSTGQDDGRAQSALHWNGEKWSEKRIYFNTNSIVVPIRGISVLDDNNFYLAAGSIFTWGTNTDTAEITFFDPNASINKLWITSPSSIYGVGNKGTIVHFNGSSWRSIESGTDLALTDIYGIKLDEIYITGVNDSEVRGILLKGNSHGFNAIKHAGLIDISELFEKLYGTLSTIWLDEMGNIYTGGSSLYWYTNQIWNYLESHDQIQRGYIYSIRGNAGNDYVMAGDRNTLLHYNGIDWRQIGIDFNSMSSIILRKVEQKGNIIAAVGFAGRQAIIIILKR